MFNFYFRCIGANTESKYNFLHVFVLISGQTETGLLKGEKPLSCSKVGTPNYCAVFET